MCASARTLDADVVVERGELAVVVDSCNIPMDSREDALGKGQYQMAMLQKTEGPMKALKSKMDGGNGIRVCVDAAAIG